MYSVVIPPPSLQKPLLHAQGMNPGRLLQQNLEDLQKRNNRQVVDYPLLPAAPACGGHHVDHVRIEEVKKRDEHTY